MFVHTELSKMKVNKAIGRNKSLRDAAWVIPSLPLRQLISSQEIGEAKVIATESIF